MADLIGFSAIAFISLVTVLIALRFPNISNFLYVALIVRILTIFFGHYIFILPDSTADMESFEREAWRISERGFFNLLDYFKEINIFLNRLNYYSKGSIQDYGVDNNLTEKNLIFLKNTHH